MAKKPKKGKKTVETGWLGVCDLARYLGVHPTTICRWDRQRVLPTPCLLRGIKKWKRDKIDSWMQLHKRVDRHLRNEDEGRHPSRTMRVVAERVAFDAGLELV